MEEKSINRPKRIAMYVIYDKDGILDGFRKYYLQELRKEVDYIVGVISGPLTPESRKELEALTDDFFVRENVGLLAYSWIDGIAHIGWDTLAEYDELLMLNDSFFGPFYPLKDMFDACERSDSDFYGVMQNFEEESFKEMAGRPLKHGHFRGSICYFYIIKERLLHSPEFKKYWSSKPKVTEDWDTYFFSEIEFFDYVKDAGFKIDAYQTDKLKDYFFNNLTHNMKMLVEGDKIPFARARALTSDLKGESLQIGYCSDPRDTLSYVEKDTDYDVSLIWDYLLRTKSLTDIWNQLQLQYVVPKSCVEKDFSYNKKIAIIMCITEKEQVALLAEYCKNFSGIADFYIASTSDDICEQINREFKNRNLHVNCLVCNEKNDELTTLWVTYADVILSDNYEYFCYLHDVMNQHKMQEERLANRCYQNLIATEQIIKNIINLFEENSKLGILSAPLPYHGKYYLGAVRHQYMNYQRIKDFADQLDLKVYMNLNKIPISAYGNMFWFRADALRKAINHKLSYEDIEELRKAESGIYSVVECCYGYIAQDAGFYCASVINTDEARSDLANYQYMMQNIGSIMIQNGHYPFSFAETEAILRSYCGHVRSYRYAIKQKIKRYCPKFIWKIARKIYRSLGGIKWVG